MRAKFPYQKKCKRVGRGPGSGHGKTATRGHKGQRSRSGTPQRAGFEGGQNPLYRRLPKRGFNNAAFRARLVTINVDRLAHLEEKEITPEIMLSRGVISKLGDGVKILGDGEVKKAVTVKAHRFSASAKEKIEKAGGKAVVIAAYPKKQEAKPTEKGQ